MNRKRESPYQDCEKSISQSGCRSVGIASFLLTLSRVILSTLSLAFPTATSYAADDDAGLWVTTSASAEIAGRWTGELLVQTRFFDDIHDLERTVVRPSVSYRMTEEFTATLGYDVHLIESAGHRIEQRLWQQWEAKWQLRSFDFSARTRLEQRFIEEGDDTALRLRIMGGLSHPIGDGPWFAVVSNEYFVGLNDVDSGPRSGFDQNRFFLGVGHAVSEHITAEFGYQMQFIDRSPEAAVAIHQVIITLNYR